MKHKLILIMAIFGVAIILPIVFLYAQFQDDEPHVEMEMTYHMERVTALEESSEFVENQLSELIHRPLNEDQLYDIIEWLHFGIIDEMPPYSDYGRIDLNTPQDMLRFWIGNGRDIPLPFMFKVFYNYEEVPFRISGTEEYITEFLFTVDNEHEMYIPFHLDESVQANDMLNKLTIGIFTNPAEFVMFDRDFETSYGHVLNYEISYGGNERLILPTAPSEPIDTGEAMNFHGLVIGETNSVSDGFEHEVLQPLHLQVSPGEKIELSFQTNPYGFVEEEINSFVIILMTDWQQTLLNGEPYLHFSAEHGIDIGNYGRFTMTAPEELGLYDVSSLIIANPTNSSSLDSFFPIETGFRFTIEVVE